MLAKLSWFVPLALEGEWNDIRAILVVVASFVILVGSIYMLLWSNLGAKVAYLVTMVSLMAFTITMSLVWLIGAPGTAPGTGPRAGKPSDKLLVATEPHWVPFLAESEQGREFADAIQEFPEGWDRASGAAADADQRKIYAGNIDPSGELEALESLVTEALAARAREQNKGVSDPAQQLQATTPEDWEFRLPGAEALPGTAEETLPEAEIAFYQNDTPLLFGLRIPATDKHGEVTVFAFRDKGRTFLYSLYFLIVGILGFLIHMWLLARTERAQKEREADAEVKLG